ncbi:MAG: hypothetical protein ABW184_11995 [Sphingobium sp.]
MAILSDDWVETALKVTGHFEDSSQPLSAVTGDFDGMGLSLGVLQWNIGSGSLQPMVKPLGLAAVTKAMPTYGADFWKACNAPIPAGLAICRGWHSGTALKAPVRKELRAFTGSPVFVAQQVARARKIAEQALAAAKTYAKADPAMGGIVTKATFCWFFDVYTQNGGLKGLDHGDVAAFIAQHGATGVDDRICDWLEGRAAGTVGYRDALSNAVLWRNKVAAPHLSLFVLSYLRSSLSRTEYRADVLNRKATIATRVGWVHREKHDLTALLK